MNKTEFYPKLLTGNKEKPKQKPNPYSLEELVKGLPKDIQIRIKLINFDSILNYSILSRIISSIKHNERNPLIPHDGFKYNVLCFILLIKHFQVGPKLKTKENDNYRNCLMNSLKLLIYKKDDNEQKCQDLLKNLKPGDKIIDLLDIAIPYKGSKKPHLFSQVIIKKDNGFERIFCYKLKLPIYIKRGTENSKGIFQSPEKITGKNLRFSQKKQKIGNCGIIAIILGIQMSWAIDKKEDYSLLITNNIKNKEDYLHKVYKKKYKLNNQRIADILINLLLEVAKSKIIEKELKKLRAQEEFYKKSKRDYNKKIFKEDKSLKYYELLRRQQDNLSPTKKYIINFFNTIINKKLRPHSKRAYVKYYLISVLITQKINLQEKICIIEDLLVDKSEIVRIEAAWVIANSAILNANKKILGNNKKIINALINMFQKGSLQEKIHAAWAIGTLAILKANKKIFGKKKELIKAFTDLLRKGSLQGKIQAARAIANLAVLRENRIIFGKNEKLINALIDMLQKGSQIEKNQAARAIANLATLKESIEKFGNYKVLISAMKKGFLQTNTFKLKLNCLKFFYYMADINKYRKLLIEDKEIMKELQTIVVIV
ncbi:hypothetical protein ACFL2K_02120 [Candidatus Margulisiibacteriota bacterium]